jgi:hypothetical protein
MIVLKFTLIIAIILISIAISNKKNSLPLAYFLGAITVFLIVIIERLLDS